VGGACEKAKEIGQNGRTRNRDCRRVGGKSSSTTNRHNKLQTTKKEGYVRRRESKTGIRTDHENDPASRQTKTALQIKQTEGVRKDKRRPGPSRSCGLAQEGQNKHKTLHKPRKNIDSARMVTRCAKIPHKIA